MISTNVCIYMNTKQALFTYFAVVHILKDESKDCF